MGKNKFLPRMDPDEIFMDAANIPSFDVARMEGRIEKPIGKRVFSAVFYFFILIATAFFFRAFYLQVVKGEAFSLRSRSNSLKNTPLFPARGIVTDRNGKEIAWNSLEFRILAETTEGEDVVLDTVKDWVEAEKRKDELAKSGDYLSVRLEPFSTRYYFQEPGLSHVLGYIGLPSKKEVEEKKDIPLESLVGKEGIEKYYEETLRGERGVKILEKDSSGNIISENIQREPRPGKNLKLSLDAGVQSYLFRVIRSTAETYGFNGGAGVMVDINTGELLSLTSYPEYDSNILSRGKPVDLIKKFFSDPNKPFLNRSISGLYTPGSIVKPMVAIGALNEKIITPEKQIFSAGYISIPNPYFPDKETIFRDWRAHGWVDMRKALSVSSDVYFYTVGGGYEDMVGLGIRKIGEYARLFGFENKTGIDLFGEQSGTVPTPELKAEKDKADPVWRVGDTYNSSIGQGYFQVTPIEMAIYAAALANNGTIITPHLLAGEETLRKNLNMPQEYFSVIKDGMRQGVANGGTAAAVNVDYVKIGAKTGTAEVGFTKNKVNSWIIGFFPYENPKYAFCITMEQGPVKNLVGASSVARQLFDWMNANAPEYFKNGQ